MQFVLSAPDATVGGDDAANSHQDAQMVWQGRDVNTNLQTIGIQ